jgi:hypothetical protein
VKKPLFVGGKAASIAAAEHLHGGIVVHARRAANDRLKRVSILKIRLEPDLRIRLNNCLS